MVVIDLLGNVTETFTTGVWRNAMVPFQFRKSKKRLLDTDPRGKSGRARLCSFSITCILRSSAYSYCMYQSMDT